LKIFEAMAMGRAVVSTAVGAEGLPITPGRDIVIADHPDRFAQAVIDLMRDTRARRRIEAAGHQLVSERYDWSAVAHQFEQALLDVTGSHTASRRDGKQDIRENDDENFRVRAGIRRERVSSGARR
jgi:glycosyltransferase involved in cell wall biosynthesis